MLECKDADSPLRYFAEVTIELLSPLHVGAGSNSDGALGVDFVRDPNGVPTIPGTSLAGALRAAYSRSSAARDDVDSLFGHGALMGADGTASEEGRGSRLWVSWAALLDSTGERRTPRIRVGEETDPLVKAACKGLKRTHVRLNHRGVADDGGLFETVAVQRGHRLMFDLTLEGDESDNGSWNELRRALTDTRLRLGGATRRGYGKIRVVEWRQRVFDLRLPTSAAAYGEHRAGVSGKIEIGVTEGWTFEPLEPAVVSGLVECKLALVAMGTWTYGRAQSPPAPEADGPTIRAPWRETIVRWVGPAGSPAGSPVEDAVQGTFKGELLPGQWVLPASSIKGALRHRTEYWLRVLRAHWEFAPEYVWLREKEVSMLSDKETDKEKDDSAASDESIEEALASLFGAIGGVANTTGGDGLGTTGMRGRVLIDDVYPSGEGSAREVSMTLTHVALDRFTAGPLPGQLFTEEVSLPRAGTVFHLAIAIDDVAGVAPDVGKAFRRAVGDLCAGRLSLGGGAARGHGAFEKQSEEWSDPHWGQTPLRHGSEEVMSDES